ncbi:MAG: hypothetical protein CVU84_15735 [Firmicutes bacterium HGW-Firmicutes-1]|jgi:HlyD family secretion protein|nr:MAG: hypothetical protein CVU84_15735 [Firmicutes bacterium HGW-Firmicutes-1]
MKKKKKIIIGLLIFSVVLIMIVLNMIKANKGEGGFSVGKGKTYSVEAKTIELLPIESTVIVAGRVEEVNKEDIILPSQVVIQEWLVEKGDVVKKGDTLLKIDLSTLKTELAQLQLSKEGQVLQMEKIQVASDISMINLQSAKALYDNLLITYTNNEALYSEGIISKSDLDASSKQLADALNQVTIAELNLAQGDTQAIENGNTSGIDIAIQQKRIEEINLNMNRVNEEISKLNKATTSPIDGIITQINVPAGTMATAMQAACTIVDSKELKIVANIREYDIKKIATGQKAMITGDAIKEDANIIATISYIDPIARKTVEGAKEETVITVELTIIEGATYLKPGYTTDCEITTEAKEQAIIASYEMFKEDKDGSKYVFVIDENNTLRRQPVTLGIISDFNAEIVEGLKVGDKVVINPSLILKEGVKVEIMPEEE